MTADDAERERAEIRAMAVRHDEDRAFPPVPPADVQAVRQRMPGLRQGSQQGQDAA